ncbi:hypothetical protein ACQPZF_11405 [Actinosynnema sp. CS-041913]|uniref:hypothetical protein n=1 Tax=Actinosynnema sp. CS-041913 TaxID=3239917 RepID=UPI003D8EAC39
MTFSEAQFNAAIEKINGGMGTLSQKMGEIRPAAAAGLNHFYIPDFVKDAVMYLVDKVVAAAQWLWDKFVELLKGIAAPVLFFKYAFDWQDVKHSASNVAGQAKPEVLRAGLQWTGPAATSYGKIIGPQGNAAGKLGTIADKLSVALGLCAAAGLAFYVALGFIIAQFVIAFVGVVAALGSVAFSWAGVALAAGQTTISAGLVTAAVTTLVAVLGVQAQQMAAIRGEAVDNGFFPGPPVGHWPDPSTGQYSDGTVKDGDADWSLNK